MPLFTVILKLGKNTHVAQIVAESALEAFRQWGDDIGKARGAGHPFPDALSVADRSPQKQIHLTNYWQATVMDADRPETVHLIQTEGPAA